MCNCGNKRMNYQQEQNELKPLILTKRQKQNTYDQYFEYIGKTALSVKGNITGKNYRFAFTGDRQIIDERDAEAMLNVPVLKKVV